MYPVDELYREMSFISYYFHWSGEEVMALDHNSRRRWCNEISGINRSLNPSDSKAGKVKSITEFTRPRMRGEL
ncbi:MAG: DUF6760 family protein [Angelakisella sp.]